MGEFEFIADYLSQLAGKEALGLKDDAAIWAPKMGQDAVITMDTIVEDVHFPKGKFDAELARKLLRVNISDLTAKGADPIGYFMSLSLPREVREQELAKFCDGLARDQEEYGVKLWGGDTTRTLSACSLSVTMIGTVLKGKAVLRSGAKPGDILCVTGTIGDSYLGLSVLYNQLDDEDYDSAFWLQSYHIPNPPFKARHIMGKFARAALDVSDGLLADAGHLARASNVGIDIDLERIPLSMQTKAWLKEYPDPLYRRTELACGGDDYQVLMAVPQSDWDDLQKGCDAFGVMCTQIGAIVEGSSVRCFDAKGNELSEDVTGYTHF